MAPINSVIIDTDPGTDDILAMLLAFAAPAAEVEVLLLSITYGNVALQHCLKNSVALFSVLEKEIEWRRHNGKAEGFPALRAHKPLVAVGADSPLGASELILTLFHGKDGLHGVHDAHPHLSSDIAWKALFDKEPNVLSEASALTKYFSPSKEPAHREILRVLAEKPPGTVSVVVMGPLTNVAIAAAEAPETFLRAKEIIVMGGAIEQTGNITPVAEFNTYADVVAAARVFALTSLNPRFTMPPSFPKAQGDSLPDYPLSLSKRLNLTLFPTDITSRHCLDEDLFNGRVGPLVQDGSPLAQWIQHFMEKSYEHIRHRNRDGMKVDYPLHDPLLVWYLLTRDAGGWQSTGELEDIRIETIGQWTRGMHVLDRRQRRQVDPSAEQGLSDIDNWLSAQGNKIHRITESPDSNRFQNILLDYIFG